MNKSPFTKKLKSKTGASILLALAFFLMCFFVASVVMASASVNASRALAQKEEQRSYFAIESAQNLIKDMFEQINGASRLNNVQTVKLGEETGENGETIDINTTVYGGYHLREVNTIYDWCNEGRTYQLYGKMEKTGDNPDINDDGNDVSYKSNAFGIDCIGDESLVFLQSSIEEVTALALCKRLHDQGVSSLEGYGAFSTYFDEVDDDFNLATETVSDTDKSLKYVYYFDISPTEEAGDNEANIPTVHVKMTADNNANLYFELTVDSRFSATYSASVKAKATIETMTPSNTYLDEALKPYDELCTERSTPEKDEYHLVRTSITDTYVTWYTDNIEVTKGVKTKTTT